MDIRPLILAVDDDAHILQIIKWELTSQGCQVITSRNGEEALEIARCIADRPPHAVQMAKDAVLHAFDGSMESGLDYERRLFEVLFSSRDAQEGLTAFREKREPRFIGE